jgi:hypothetical protein
MREKSGDKEKRYLELWNRVEAEMEKPKVGIKTTQIAMLCVQPVPVRSSSFWRIRILRYKIRIWISIKMESRIQIRIGIKMMPIHNTARYTHVVFCFLSPLSCPTISPNVLDIKKVWIYILHTIPMHSFLVFYLSG